MNGSSFFCGVLIGVTSAILIANKKSMMLSPGDDLGGSLANLTGITNGKNESKGAQSHSNTPNETPDRLVQSKESNLKLLTDFIKGNPDVRREVEQILKETNTTIKGLST